MSLLFPSGSKVFYLGRHSVPEVFTYSIQYNIPMLRGCKASYSPHVTSLQGRIFPMLQGYQSAYSSCYRLQGCVFPMLQSCKAVRSQSERETGLHQFIFSMFKSCKAASFIFLLLQGCKAAYPSCYLAAYSTCTMLQSCIFPIFQSFKAAYSSCCKNARLHIPHVTRLQGCIFPMLQGSEAEHSPCYTAARLHNSPCYKVAYSQYYKIPQYSSGVHTYHVTRHSPVVMLHIPHVTSLNWTIFSVCQDTYSYCYLVTLYQIPHHRLYCYCWLTLSLYAAHGYVYALHLLYIYTNKVGKQLKFWPDYTLHFACKPGLLYTP
jgi:hypothetical protein